MFHDKTTTHASGKAGPAGIRRTVPAPDAISRCQRAALHEPGHWHHAAPDEVPRIVRRWLQGHPQTPDELRAYAAQAPAGRTSDLPPLLRYPQHGCIVPAQWSARCSPDKRQASAACHRSPC